MNVAGAHPNSTRAATAKTKPSETPFASAPSTGTGKRSASVEATRNAPTPASVVPEPGARANATVATAYAVMPTRETGTTTASNLAGGCARPLIRGATLPGEVESPPGEVGEIRGDCEKRHRCQNRRHLGVPLEHLRSPP